MPLTEKASPVRERILSVASDLFYTQGYHPTGTNQIIKEARVAKASFYDHFPTKEHLGVAYVRQHAQEAQKHFSDLFATHPDPLERFWLIHGEIRNIMVKTRFRGCSFTNIAREFPDPAAPVRMEVIKAETDYRDMLKSVIRDLFESDPKKYRNHLKRLEEITNSTYLILEGAITVSVNLNDPWPFDAAETALGHLIEP